jgi:hypothetical protein
MATDIYKTDINNLIIAHYIFLSHQTASALHGFNNVIQILYYIHVL